MKKIEEEKEQNINAKLPKLVITQFKGTPADWMRFWGQFTAEIDAADISQITKFSYPSSFWTVHRWPPVDHRRLQMSKEYFEVKIREREQNRKCLC